MRSLWRNNKNKIYASGFCLLPFPGNFNLLKNDTTSHNNSSMYTLEVSIVANLWYYQPDDGNRCNVYVMERPCWLLRTSNFGGEDKWYIHTEHTLCGQEGTEPRLTWVRSKFWMILLIRCNAPRILSQGGQKSRSHPSILSMQYDKWNKWIRMMPWLKRSGITSEKPDCRAH